MKSARYKEFVKKSILAGILIGLGGFSNLRAKDATIGAVMFSIGLISVILLKCNLYTGKVGYARRITKIPALSAMCLLNILGAGLLGAATSPVISEAAFATMDKKLNRPLIYVFITSAVCGALIYLAVELFKIYRSIILIILPVFTFVATGADHCIANAYYLSAGKMFSIKALVYMLVCILGNAVGSLIISLMQVKPE